MYSAFIIFLILIIGNNTFAYEFPKIFGCFCEGGVISGSLTKDDKVKIEGERIKIFDDGTFIFAFGRKFKDNVEIEINNVTRKFGVLNQDYKIEKIQGLPSNKVEPSMDDIKKIKSDQFKIQESKKVGLKKRIFTKKFVLPSKGRLSGVYGSQRILNSKPRRPHAGIDIAAKEGTPILAPSSGIIKLTERNMFFTGNTVILDHGVGLISIFAHLNKINVNEGDQIEQGENIGTIGMTGRATGPHLHWGVYLRDVSVDPMSLINFELF
ncbi:MAG: M23 family metallopeptidase [Pseudomonadota bacterium]|nr:M23 family metallopeptidase [Pseudomonadota bacterium]